MGEIRGRRRNMSISSVNPYMSMLAAYKAATADNKQSNMPLDTVESTQAKATTRPGSDTVSISQEAAQKSRAEQYALKDDPIGLFLEWKEKGVDTINLGETPIDKSELLPENVEFITQLKEEYKSASSLEERRSINADISTVTRYGSDEIFTSRSDIQSRLQAEAKSASLQANYLLEKNGELPFKLDKMETAIPSLSEITGINDTPVFRKEVASREYLAKFDDIEFLDRLLTQIYSGTKEDEIGLILPDMA